MLIHLIPVLPVLLCELSFLDLGIPGLSWIQMIGRRMKQALQDEGLSQESFLSCTVKSGIA
jgi:hypothetical protein